MALVAPAVELAETGLLIAGFRLAFCAVATIEPSDVVAMLRASMTLLASAAWKAAEAAAAVVGVEEAAAAVAAAAAVVVDPTGVVALMAVLPSR